MLHNSSQWRALRLADTWTKVEEVKGHWKEDQRLAFLGRRPGGWRVEEVWGRGFFLCLLILCLLKLASDFSGEDARCFLVLSTAMTTLTCMCSGAKLVPTNLHPLPAYRPVKKPKTFWQLAETYLKTKSKTACIVYPCCKEFLPVLVIMKSIIVILVIDVLVTLV